MGKVISTVAKPLKNFNIENRAMKALERQAKSAQPKAAPRYPDSSTGKSFYQQTRDNMDLQEVVKNKNEVLHDRLRQVRVDSTGVAPEDSLVSKSKGLPLSREKVEQNDFGYLIPDVIQEGRVSLPQVIEFITHHQNNPVDNSADKISAAYKLDRVIVQEILTHFRSYNMYVPKKIRDKVSSASEEEIKLMARPPKTFAPSEEEVAKLKMKPLQSGDIGETSR